MRICSFDFGPCVFLTKLQVIYLKMDSPKGATAPHPREAAHPPVLWAHGPMGQIHLQLINSSKGALPISWDVCFADNSKLRDSRRQVKGLNNKQHIQFSHIQTLGDVCWHTSDHFEHLIRQHQWTIGPGWIRQVPEFIP